MKAFITSILILLALLAIVGGVALAGFLVRQQIGGAAQAELRGTFGDDILALCATPPAAGAPSAGGRLNKYLVIDTQNKRTYKPYQDALGVDRSATSKADLTTLACITANHHPFADEPSCAYSGSNEVINRFSNDVKLIVIDVAAHKTIATKNVSGADPAECPGETSSYYNIQGAPPAPGDFIDALTNTHHTTG